MNQNDIFFPVISIICRTLRGRENGVDGGVESGGALPEGLAAAHVRGQQLLGGRGRLLREAQHARHRARVAAARRTALRLAHPEHTILLIKKITFHWVRAFCRFWASTCPARTVCACGTTRGPAASPCTPLPPPPLLHPHRSHLQHDNKISSRYILEKFKMDN